jgi:hypothetical protein
MLDEVLCASLTEADHPTVSVKALCDLVKLLDDGLRLVADSRDECKLVPSQKESRSPSQYTSAAVAPPGQPERVLHAGDGSSAVPGFVGRVVKRRRSCRKQSS